MKSLVFSLIAATTVLAGASQPADAGTWACQVALCISNPGGPTEYPACVPPIERLYTWLSNPLNSFPICSLAGEGSIDHYQAVILVPKKGNAIASGQAWVLPMAGQTSPDVITVTGSAVQVYQDFTGKIIGFPY